MWNIYGNSVYMLSLTIQVHEQVEFPDTFLLIMLLAIGAVP